MEELEKIAPAVPEDSSPNEISSDAFQKMLYQWYEEKGLVSNLRSHLRVLMINKLRNTSILGKYEKKPSNFTLPKQAFSLVIAEHLLREGCHYTLSIFSTEVPVVANQLPSSLYEAHCNNEETKWRFDSDSVLNLLELIGISKGSKESLKVIGLYTKKFGSLLTCLVSAKKSVDAVPTSVDNNNTDTPRDFLSYFKQILVNLGVPNMLIEKIESQVQDYVAYESGKNVEILKRENSQMKNYLNNEIIQRDNTITLMTEQQIKLKNDNKTLKTDLKNVKKKLNQTASQQNNLRITEEALEDKIEQIRKLEIEVKDSVEKLEKESRPCLLTHCTDSCTQNVKIKTELEKQILHLQELNKDQDLETERLHAKINSLYKDLQNSQNKVDFLNACLSNLNHLNMQQQEETGEVSGESSDNITEDVLRQVHTRLMHLEKESEELDLRFKRLKMK